MSAEEEMRERLQRGRSSFMADHCYSTGYRWKWDELPGDQRKRAADLLRQGWLEEWQQWLPLLQGKQPPMPPLARDELARLAWWHRDFRDWLPLFQKLSDCQDTDVPVQPSLSGDVVSPQTESPNP
jgi:hypothetical protein